MSMNVDAVLKRANIIIGSYLGKTEELQEKRLLRHIKQRNLLAEQFPNLVIVSLCTCYPKHARIALYPHEAIHQDKHQYKYQDHNRILKLLYKQKNAAKLLLDDDVVPIALEDLPNQTPVETLTGWLLDPKSMPAPCMYFCTKGIWADMYYRSRKAELVACPLLPSGWATLVRNDLNVLFKKDEVIVDGVQLAEDGIFRAKCAAEGKEVLKDLNLFFKTFQNTGSNDKGSAWHENRDARNDCVRRTKEAIMKFWPWMMLPSIRPGVPRPVWTLKGDQRISYVRAGLLEKKNHSYVPTKKLKKWWEEQNSRPSLADMIPKKKDKK